MVGWLAGWLSRVIVPIYITLRNVQESGFSLFSPALSIVSFFISASLIGNISL